MVFDDFLGGLGATLGVPWGSLGDPWGTLGGPWGVLGGPWGVPGGLQVPSTVLEGASRGPRGVLEGARVALGAPRGRLCGLLGSILDPQIPGAVLRPAAKSVGNHCTRRYVGIRGAAPQPIKQVSATERPRRALGGTSEGTRGAFEEPWGRFGRSLGGPRGSLGALGGGLGDPWGVLGGP